MPKGKRTQSISRPSIKGEPANLRVAQAVNKVPGPVSDFDRSGAATTAPKPAFLNFRIARAIGMIESDYSVPQLNLGLISQQLGFTKPYLCRVFKREVGMGIPEYVCRVRVRAAEKLLRETVLSIKEVAAAVGFTYITQLGRAFKGIYGCAPKEYRRKISLDYRNVTRQL